MALGLGFDGSGFRAWSFGFRVLGLGLRVQFRGVQGGPLTLGFRDTCYIPYYGP